MSDNRVIARLAFGLLALVFAAPATAASAIAQVPEGSSVTLFALGALGVLIGRKLSMRRTDED